MMIKEGATAHFVVFYDDSLAARGKALADAVLQHCEGDFTNLVHLFGGVVPVASSLPFKVNLVPGAGGAGHPTCSSTTITVFAANADTAGVFATVLAEVVEVFEAAQNQGVNCGYSNDEALSRVLPTVFYPALSGRFSTGNEWLNSTQPSARPDSITKSVPTDTDFVSIGCGSLFLNYLAYQLRVPWPKIIAAMAPNLGDTARNLWPCAELQSELQNISPGDFPNHQAYEQARASLTRQFMECEKAGGVRFQEPFKYFYALMAYHYPLGAKTYLPNDNPFPLAWPP